MARGLNYPIKPKVHLTVAGKSLLVGEIFAIWPVVPYAEKRGGEPYLKLACRKSCTKKKFEKYG
jgi:hypothetical protein